VAITYTITEGESVMGSTSAAEVAEHVVLAGASYTVQGTPEERVEGTRRVEEAQRAGAWCILASTGLAIVNRARWRPRQRPSNLPRRRQLIPVAR